MESISINQSILSKVSLIFSLQVNRDIMIFYLLLKCWFNNCLREACLLLETVSLRRAMWLMGILFIMNCTEAYGHVGNHIAWFDNCIDVFIDHDDYSEWRDTLLSCLYYLLDQLHCQILFLYSLQENPWKNHEHGMREHRG